MEIVKDGSPTFYQFLDELSDTHQKKSHDYASNDNPVGNYHFAGRIAGMFAHSPDDAGFAGRLAEKLYRLANLEKAKKTPLNESIADTERDIAVITVLWMSDRRDRRGINLFQPESEAAKQEKLMLQLIATTGDMNVQSLSDTINYLERLRRDKVNDA